jgi:phosphatidylserine decarboxylase
MVKDIWQWCVIMFVRCLPRNFMSRVAGWIASWQLPQPLRQWQLKSFGRTFGVQFDEIKDPLTSFQNVQAFFTRELREGVRPIDPASDAFVAPCDGAWGESGTVENGTLLQIKGRPYRVASLLGNSEEAKRYEGGTFATFYLSPKDYHRFHAPCDGQVRHVRYIPGTLWPVNRAGVRWVDGLFAENERIVTFLEMGRENGEGELVLIPVGATMVGKVKLTFDDLETNEGGRDMIDRDYSEKPHSLIKGEEWGRFEFGSTIVMLATPGLVALDSHSSGEGLVLGTRIGTINS